MNANRPTPAQIEDAKEKKLHDRLKGNQPPLENMPSDQDTEDRDIEGGKPDLAETEEDISRL